MFSWKTGVRGLLAFSLSMVCSAATENSNEHTSGRVDIRRTAYGVPHVVAADEYGLGYGFGYAYAQDNVCTLAKEITKVRGERSLYFGDDNVAGSRKSNISSDAFYRWFNSKAKINTFLHAQSRQTRALLKGYSDGYNRYIVSSQFLGGNKDCLGRPWVTKITEQDLARIIRRLMIHAGTFQFANYLLAPVSPERSSTLGAPLRGHKNQLSIGFTEPTDSFGSNGLAIGSELSNTGHGLLIGNPHFPWSGDLRLYQVQLTIPGKLNVAGASLPGFPMINIGFNDSLAWTHTVDASKHYLIYRLQLKPGNPSQYLLDGRARAFKVVQISVPYRKLDGSLGRQIYFVRESVFGPVLEGLEVGNRTAPYVYAIHDPNVDNARALPQWYDLARASSVTDFQGSLNRIMGVPWVTSIAADSRGSVLFANVSAIPYISTRQLQYCRPLSPSLKLGGALILDGARTACRWRSATGASQLDIFPGSELPQLQRLDYVQNSNDSAWYTNPRSPVVGFPPIVSIAPSQLSGRARLTISWLSDAQARGIKVSQADLAKLITDNHVYFSNSLLDDIKGVCESYAPGDLMPADESLVKEACESMARWDGTAKISSNIGTYLFSRVFSALEKVPDHWRVPFDSLDPLGTPAGYRISSPAVRKAILGELVKAISSLPSSLRRAESTWGDIQAVSSAARLIPIPGAEGKLGVYNAISGVLANGRITPTYGSSYIQIVDIGPDGPNAKTVLTFSQSTNANSEHSSDQTSLFSQGRWVSFPFSERSIRENLISEQVLYF